jgi:hypothetical protein
MAVKSLAYLSVYYQEVGNSPGSTGWRPARQTWPTWAGAGRFDLDRVIP